MAIDSNKRLRLGAAMIVLMLAVGHLSAALSLAAWEPDVCDVECCIARGHCCCDTRHAYVRGREPKPDEARINTETQWLASGPALCSKPAVSAQDHQPRATPPAAPLMAAATILFPGCRDQIPPDYFFAALPSSPRAPPLV
jgi:hypothetical protein